MTTNVLQLFTGLTATQAKVLAGVVDFSLPKMREAVVKAIPTPPELEGGDMKKPRVMKTKTGEFKVKSSKSKMTVKKATK